MNSEDGLQASLLARAQEDDPGVIEAVAGNTFVASAGLALESLEGVCQ